MASLVINKPTPLLHALEPCITDKCPCGIQQAMLHIQQLPTDRRKAGALLG